MSCCFRVSGLQSATVVAQHIAGFFGEAHNREVIQRLRRAGLHWEAIEPAGARPLAGRPQARGHRPPQAGQGGAQSMAQTTNLAHIES